MFNFIKNIFNLHSNDNDLYEDAFLCIWRSYDFNDPLAYLKKKYSGKNAEEVQNALNLADALHSEVNNIPFYYDEESPPDEKVINHLKNKIPGLSERAYITAADKVWYLWHK